MSRAQNVVTDWNAIASRTIAAQSGKPASFAPFFAYTSIAVYDAVNSIHGRFRPFYFAGVTDRNASDQAAAISAAHAVLVRYFPAQQAELDAQFQESLGRIVGRSRHARQAGVEAGEAAAQALIAARTGDGLEADFPNVPGTELGDWQPTPPGFLAAAIPWLGQMRPFTMKSPSQFLPRGAYPLSSEQWGGRLQSDAYLWRVPQHPSLAGANRNRAVLDRASGPKRRTHLELLFQTYKLDVPDSARLMAILWTGLADALIGCFNAKYQFGFWRPVNAISGRRRKSRTCSRY